VSEAEAKGTFCAGVLVRRHIKHGLKQMAFQYDIDLSLEEDKGWLDSWFTFKAIGSESNVKRFTDATNQWFRELSKDA
jgi:hypothetical protein